MKRLAVIYMVLVIMSACVREVDKEVEVVKTVTITPSGATMPDSLSWFFSNATNVSSYNHTLSELSTYDSYNNNSPDYIIVTYGRDKSALNLPDSTLLPCNCITFTSFKNNVIASFIHYRIKDWSQDWKNEDMKNNGIAGIKWNYKYFYNEFVYAVVPGSGSKTYRNTVKIQYPF